MYIIIAFPNLSRTAKMILFIISFVPPDNSKYMLISFSIDLYTVDNIAINYPRSAECRDVSGAMLSSPRSFQLMHNALV